jgi:hypothetical protein
MARDTLSIADTLALLAAAPQHIAALTDGVAPDALRAAPAAGEWSATEVLAHMRACADMWGGSILALLAEDAPTVRAINPLTWIKQTDYPRLDFAASFRAFVAQRAELLAALEPLAPAGWQRAGTFTGAGAPLTRTVHSQAQRLAIHERPHLKQLAQTVAALRG